MLLRILKIVSKLIELVVTKDNHLAMPGNCRCNRCVMVKELRAEAEACCADLEDVDELEEEEDEDEEEDEEEVGNGKSKKK